MSARVRPRRHLPSGPSEEDHAMAGRFAVFVHAADPISQAGIASQLRGRPELWVVDDVDIAAVAVIVADDVDDETLLTVRAVQRNGCPRVVLVATHLDDGGLLAAAEAGACGMLRRAEAGPERLAAACQAA